MTPWTVAHQSTLSMRLPRQEYWSGLPFLSPGDLPNPGIEPEPPALAGGFFTTEPPGKPNNKRPKAKSIKVKISCAYILISVDSVQFFSKHTEHHFCVRHWVLHSPGGECIVGKTPKEAKGWDSANVGCASWYNLTACLRTSHWARDLPGEASVWLES